jgi:CBS domain-containing protein
VNPLTKRLMARNIMSSPVDSIEERATLEKVAAKLLSKGISALLVAPASDEEPFGIVTTADLVGAVASGLRPNFTRVADVMSSPLLVVTPNVPIEYVARLMERANVRHVAVFNGREIVGIISHRDVVRAMTPEHFEEPVKEPAKAVA